MARFLEVATWDGEHPVATRYWDEGSGAATVLLHGGLGSADDWHHLAPALAHSRRVLRPERRGHGRTADVGAG